MITIEEIRDLYDFEPKYTFSRLNRNLTGAKKQIKDSRLYKEVIALTRRAYPSQAHKHDKRWLDFYLPLKRRGYFILVPMGIVLNDKRFFLYPYHSEIEVCEGGEKNEFYRGLIEQTLEFSRIIKKDPGIVTKAIPYDMRTGRILGKYVMEELLPAGKKKEILMLYREHMKRRKSLHSISLNDYLDTAAICYRAAFGDKTFGMTAEQMYLAWADGRACGMIEIKDKDSKQAFSRWLSSAWTCGGHPFEIVRGHSGLGIHLVPPSPYKSHYVLKVSSNEYGWYYLDMARALIQNKITFEAFPLDRILDYLSGESYFTVNTYSEHYISYAYRDRKLFRHIEWDDPGMLKWKE
jgi:hypothetical protein